jgi:hypothetical protein
MVPQILRSSKSSNSHFQDQSLEGIPASSKGRPEPTYTDKEIVKPPRPRIYLIQARRRVRSHPKAQIIVQSRRS